MDGGGAGGGTVEGGGRGLVGGAENHAGRSQAEVLHDDDGWESDLILGLDYSSRRKIFC